MRSLIGVICESIRVPMTEVEWIAWERWNDGALLDEDLSPQLGWPGGPCQVIQRARQVLKGPQSQGLVDKVEDGEDLTNADASKIYKDMTETLPSGLPFQKVILTAHAQYRMDQRGITIPQIMTSLKAFCKDWNNKKSQKHPTWERWMDSANRREAFQWVDQALDLTLVMSIYPTGKEIRVVTTYWTNSGKEKPPGDGGCDLWTHQYDRPTSFQDPWKDETDGPVAGRPVA